MVMAAAIGKLGVVLGADVLGGGLGGGGVADVLGGGLGGGGVLVDGPDVQSL